MKLIIAGGRDYKLTDADYAKLDAIHTETPVSEVVSGHAEGADKWGEYWADVNYIRVKPFPALWDDLEAPGAVVRRTSYGKLYNANAGPTRNAAMAAYADAVALFPGDKGTASMHSEAVKAGIKIFDFRKP